MPENQPAQAGASSQQSIHWSTLLSQPIPTLVACILSLCVWVQAVEGNLATIASQGQDEPEGIASSKIDTGIYPLGWRLSPQRDKLVIWGWPTDRVANETQSTKLVVIDLESAELVLKIDVPFASGAWVDSKYVYIASSSGGIIRRHRLGDHDDVKRVFLGQPLSKIVHGQPMALIVGDDLDPSCTFVDAESFRRIEQSDIYQARDLVFEEPLRSVILNAPADLEAVRITTLNQVPRIATGEWPVEREFAAAVHSITYSDHQIIESIVGRRGAGAAFSQSHALITNAYDLAIYVQGDVTDSKEFRFRDLSGDFDDFVGRVDLNEYPRFSFPGESPILDLGNSICTVNDGAVILVPIPEVVLRRAKRRYQFYFASSPMLDIRSKSSIRVLAEDAAPSPTFELIKEIDGVTIDANTGQIFVDGPHLAWNWVRNTWRPIDVFQKLRTSERLTSRRILLALTGERIPENCICCKLSLPIKATFNDGHTQEFVAPLFLIVPAPLD